MSEKEIGIKLSSAWSYQFGQVQPLEEHNLLFVVHLRLAVRESDLDAYLLARKRRVRIHTKISNYFYNRG